MVERLCSGWLACSVASATPPKRSNLIASLPYKLIWADGPLHSTYLPSQSCSPPFVACLPCPARGLASRIHTRFVLPKPETKHKILQAPNRTAQSVQPCRPGWRALLAGSCHSLSGSIRGCIISLLITLPVSPVPSVCISALCPILTDTLTSYCLSPFVRSFFFLFLLLQCPRLCSAPSLPSILLFKEKKTILLPRTHASQRQLSVRP